MAKRRVKRARHYNVWKTPYKALYKRTKQYAEEHNLTPFDEVYNPSQKDIEDLRRMQEERVKEEREKRKTSYYKKACEALDLLIVQAENGASDAWENEKAAHAKHTVEQAKEININDDEWGKYILSHISELKEDLERFVFLSKQTWDNNTPHESTEWWDALETLIFNW